MEHEAYPSEDPGRGEAGEWRGIQRSFLRPLYCLPRGDLAEPYPFGTPGVVLLPRVGFVQAYQSSEEVRAMTEGRVEAVAYPDGMNWRCRDGHTYPEDTSYVVCPQDGYPLTRVVAQLPPIKTWEKKQKGKRR